MRRASMIIAAAGLGLAIPASVLLATSARATGAPPAPSGTVVTSVARTITGPVMRDPVGAGGQISRPEGLPGGGSAVTLAGEFVMVADRQVGAGPIAYPRTVPAAATPSPKASGSATPAPKKTTSSGGGLLSKINISDLTRMVTALGVIGALMVIGGVLGIRSNRSRRTRSGGDADPSGAGRDRRRGARDGAAGYPEYPDFEGSGDPADDGYPVTRSRDVPRRYDQPGTYSAGTGRAAVGRAEPGESDGYRPARGSAAYGAASPGPSTYGAPAPRSSTYGAPVSGASGYGTRARGAAAPGSSGYGTPARGSATTGESGYGSARRHGSAPEAGDPARRSGRVYGAGPRQDDDQYGDWGRPDDDPRAPRRGRH